MAFIGLGTKLYRDRTGTPVAIGGITDISEVSVTADTLEVTNYDTTGGYREFIQGLKDGGDVTFTFDLDLTNAGQAALKTSFESGATEELELRLPNTAKDSIEFDAIVTSPVVAVPLEDRVTYAVTVKITGAVTFGTWT